MQVEGTASAQIEIALIADVLQRLQDRRAISRHARWLSESEHARLAGIRSEVRRNQYLAGHWLARTLLERGFGGDIAAWDLVEQRSRPPRVEGHAALHVSISHTSDWIAAAVATTAIGIDLEQRPRKLDAGIEALLLNAGETSGSIDADTLLQRWVAKEAWIKRRMESALPARLERLQLHASARNTCDVWIDSNDAFHFGVAIAGDCKLTFQSDVTLQPGPAFRVVEREG